MTISFNAAQLLNGNGIDVTSLVNQIQSQKSGMLKFWQQQQSDLQTQASALSIINTDLNNLETAVNALKDPLGPLTSVAANSSMPAILTASADFTAATGNHTIVVSALASAGTVYTSPVSGGSSVSILPSGTTGGDLQFQVGGSGGVTHDIQITKGSNDTLTTLASSINQQSTSGNWGVTAAVLTDASGARLAIYSQNTGTPGAVAITANTATGLLNTNSVANADTSILTDPLSPGDLQLHIGGSSGATVDLPITAGSNDTLNTLRDSINQQSIANNWKITASVVGDSGGYHLSIASQENGPAGALAFTTKTNTTLTATANPATSLNFGTPIGGTNASFTIDGIPFSSTTNTVNGALPGVTLNLISAEPNVPLQLSVGADTAQATTAINSFVVAYNTLITAINNQFKIDPTTNNEGPLGADASVRTLQSRLLSDVSYSISGNSGLVNLASLGINMNDDGTLTAGIAPDGRTMSQVLTQNPGPFLNFFQNTAQTGFANAFSSDLISLTDSVNGAINFDLAQNSKAQSALTDEIATFQDRLATQRNQLIASLSQVNATLQAYPYLLAQITYQLGNILPNSSNTSPNKGSSTS